MAEEIIDFDPTTEEGQEDINKTINDDYDELIPKEGEGGESFYSRIKQRFGRGYKLAIDRINDLFKEKNKGRNMPVYMELENMDDIKEREDNIREAEDKIKNVYPEWDPSKSNFLFDLDEYGRVEIRLKNKTDSKTYYLNGNKWDGNQPNKSIINNLGRSINDITEYNDAKNILDGLYPKNKISYDKDFDLRYNGDDIEVTHSSLSKWYKLFNRDNTITKRLPKIITDNIGDSAVKLSDNITEQIDGVGKEQQHVFAQVNVLNQKIEEGTSSIAANEDRISLLDEDTQSVEKERLSKEIEELRETVDTQTQTRNSLERRIRSLQSQREELENERETIEEKLPLKERVKQIIKRYGLTVTGIALAVGTIIGVIISNLKAGLTKVANGVGNGLKTIGKKLGQILPGMVGAIASFIFRTAGEVVGFLAKNAWLLIVTVVLYIVERYKKKK